MRSNNNNNNSNALDNYNSVHNTSCSRGRIRNPRTNRCVLLRTPLGACIQATAKALARRTPPGATCAATSEYDFHSGSCVSDQPRVLAIRHMKRLHAYLEKQRMPSANAMMAYANQSGVVNNYTNYNRNQRALNHFEQLMQAEAELAKCTADLRDARALVNQMQRAMMMGQ